MPSDAQFIFILVRGDHRTHHTQRLYSYVLYFNNFYSIVPDVMIKINPTYTQIGARFAYTFLFSGPKSIPTKGNFNAFR